MKIKRASKRGSVIVGAKKNREREHRLRPDLRLETVGEITKFIHKKGLVSSLGGNELPSLISAVLGRPWRPSAKGFTGWLDWWSVKIEGQRLPSVIGELERRKDILVSRLFRRSKTFVSSRLWPVLNPIIEDQSALLKRGDILSPIDLKLRVIIESEGTIRTDRLRKRAELGEKGSSYRFHRALTNLENYGLIIGAEDPQPEKHLHANIWQTWQKRTYDKTKHPRISPEESYTRLLQETIQACVLAREDEIRHWFPWKLDLQHAMETLLGSGTIVRADDYLVASSIG